MLIAVALPVPVRRTFDYLCPDTMVERLAPGVRIRVPFGRRRLVGIVVGTPFEHEPAGADGAVSYKFIESVLDESPLLSAPMLTLCNWAAAYYHHALGEVLATAIPARLRAGMPATLRETALFYLTVSGREALPGLSSRSGTLRRLLERLAASPADRAELRQLGVAASVARAERHGWIERVVQTSADPETAATAAQGPPLTEAQADALRQLAEAAAAKHTSLLDGVTGSGKTELYLQMAARAVSAGRQVLALAPEIGLTPQLAQCFEQRFSGRVACYHSGMSESDRTETWLRGRAGTVDVVVGTRSAIFVPLARPGLIVVDEEHDASYKQQEGLRYSARDLAVVRAREERIPVILGSATPSLESLHNVSTGRYRHVRLQQRISRTPLPQVTLLDVRGLELRSGLSEPLLRAVERHLGSGGQVLLFINRRGFAPLLLCGRCGWIASCTNCNARLTLHRRRHLLLCHHCGYSEAPAAVCLSCGYSPLAPVGQGTERIEEALQLRFPGRRIERIDSDRTRGAKVLARLFAAVREGAVDILVGTQILAKGHDFAGLTLAGIIDVDQALYGSDLRALERMAQLVTQVAGRVGRADRSGEVIIQTFDPQHLYLRRLVSHGYAGLASELMAERRAHGLPPAAHLMLLRADAPGEGVAIGFLEQARRELQSAGQEVDILGPVPAPMERRGGRFRAQLLFRSARRSVLQDTARHLLPGLQALPVRSGLRWSVDIDPVDLF